MTSEQRVIKRLKADKAELVGVIKFTQSVMKSQGIYDLSEKMAMKKIAKAIKKHEAPPEAQQ